MLLLVIFFIFFLLIFQTQLIKPVFDGVLRSVAELLCDFGPFLSQFFHILYQFQILLEVPIVSELCKTYFLMSGFRWLSHRSLIAFGLRKYSPSLWTNISIPISVHFFFNEVLTYSYCLPHRLFQENVLFEFPIF